MTEKKSLGFCFGMLRVWLCLMAFLCITLSLCNFYELVLEGGLLNLIVAVWMGLMSWWNIKNLKDIWDM